MFHLPVYVGQKITEVSVYVSGESGALNGELQLVYGVRGSASPTVVNIDTGNFWDTGGVTIKLASTITPTIIVQDYYHYYVRAKAPSNALEGRIHGVDFEAQFGN
jgi:hypothetical protein